MDFASGIFYALVLTWSFYVAYLIVFRILGSKEDTSHGHASHARAHATLAKEEAPDPKRDGFRAYATNGELTVEDIVKALSRK